LAPSAPGSSWTRGAELGETAADGFGRAVALDGIGDQLEHAVVPAEVGDVVEGQVDRTAHGAGATEPGELVALSLASGHDEMVRPAADLALRRR
jgi:hypothetical protein